MGQRSLLKQVLVNFLNSIKPKKLWGELRGKDEFGVEYYEDATTVRGQRPARWYAPPPGADFKHDMPVEWEAWLRHKRKLPPTEQEIEMNNLQRMRTIENAMKLEKPQKKEREPFSKRSFPVYEEYSSDTTADKKSKP